MLTGQFVEAEPKGQREMLARQLEARFGTLSPAARERLDAWLADRLAELRRALLQAKSLLELVLEG